MKVSIVLIVFGLFVFSGCTSKKENKKEVSIVVTPPQNYDPKDSILLVGTFNDWVLEGTQSVVLDYENGRLVTKLPVNEEETFFTFVKNRSFSRMPASKTGKSKCPYLYQASSNKKEIEINIPSWTGEDVPEKAAHTLTGNIQHLTDFDMSPLNRKGDVSIYLPPSYGLEINTKYPVLYMLDGQNVFDEFTAYSNEWQVDETLEKLISEEKIPEMIVVAIPNGPKRWSEYNPWDFKDRNGELVIGEGKQTMQFLLNKLKPYIDQNYRTQTQAQTTGLVGSSLGGLMALYAAIEHHDSFGYVGAFSPALTIESIDGQNVLMEALKQKESLGSTKIYFDMGKIEYDGYKEVEELERLLIAAGVEKNNLKLVKDDLGRHCEVDWSRRFNNAIQWMVK